MSVRNVTHLDEGGIDIGHARAAFKRVTVDDQTLYIQAKRSYDGFTRRSDPRHTLASI
jgi:hypothetical protein